MVKQNTQLHRVQTFRFSPTQNVSLSLRFQSLLNNLFLLFQSSHCVFSSSASEGNFDILILLRRCQKHVQASMFFVPLRNENCSYAKSCVRKNVVGCCELSKTRKFLARRIGWRLQVISAAARCTSRHERRMGELIFKHSIRNVRVFAVARFTARFHLAFAAR